MSVIDSGMRDRIEAELARIEREYGVTILFACESGSRAWGFPSRDSDFDVRIVYHHPADWYLDLQPRRDVIEEPIHDALDISGWDLDKTLRLLRKSNPNILEWVGSPIVYREHPRFGQLRELLDLGFDHRSSLLHYRNMALNNKRQWLDREQIKIKKYLYTIRPLLCGLWVLKHHNQPPMLYHELMDELCPGSELQREVEALVARKQDLNESDLVPRHPILSKWIDDSLAYLDARVPGRTSAPDWGRFNRTFHSIVGSAIQPPAAP